MPDNERDEIEFDIEYMAVNSTDNGEVTFDQN